MGKMGSFSFLISTFKHIVFNSFLSNIIIYYFSIFNMSDNIKMHESEWIKWLDEAIEKEHIKYYEYKEFSNFQEIGTGSFGKVHRASWKNLEKCFALKSFFSLNNDIVKEIV